MKIYVDGACSVNPGPGGAAALVIHDTGFEDEVCLAVNPTTNQRMEIKAVIIGLEKALMAEPNWVDVYSDSANVVNCFNQSWYKNWEKNGWLNSKKEPVANRDLWERLLALYRQFTCPVIFNKVKGHSGDEYNERVDKLAVAARLEVE